MNHRHTEALDRTRHLLVRLVVVAAVLLLVSPSVPGAAELDGDEQPAPQCSVTGQVTGAGEARSIYPALDASIPGLWRQDLALAGPHQRVPGTLAVMPQSPAPATDKTKSSGSTAKAPATSTPQDSPFDYESSEEISKDLSVSFPVDI